MNNSTRHPSLFLSLSVLAALLATTCLAPAQAVFIRADNNAALNTANAWLTNGITPSRVPTTNDTVVWDDTVSAANAIGTAGGAVLWGQIIVSNAPATVEITNNNAITLNGRIFNGTTNGLTLDGNDLSIVGQILIRSNQTWTFGPGRSLTLGAGGGEFDINRSLTLAGSGTIYYDRNVDVLSNATLTIPAGMSFLSTNGAGIVRIGQGNNAAGLATVNQTGGTVVITRGTANAALQICNNVGSTGTWNLSAGTLDVRGIDDGINNREDIQVITLGADSNINATINISGTGQMFADVINAVTADNLNAVANIRVTGDGQLTARNLILGTLGQATLTVSNNAVVAITNNLALAGFNAAQGLVGSGTVNLDGGTLITGNMARQAGTNLIGVTNATFNMNGGLLVIQRDNNNFSGPSALGAYVGMFVRAGGARVDTAGFSTTNNAALLHGTGASVDGGLIKTGLGRFTARGTNTYNGPTTVSAGELGLGTAHEGGGSITLANDTGLAVEVNEVGGTAPVSTLTFGTGGTTSLEIQTSTNGNPGVAPITATNLTANGTVNVTIKTAGDGLTVGQFPLIDYSGAIGGSGYGAFTLVELPLGVIANLVDNVGNSSVDLNVTFVPPSISWNGNVNGVWDVGGTANWQPGSAVFVNGSPVTFDDSATGTTIITLNTNVIPGGFNLLFDHSVPYSITGSGSISGTFGLLKTNTGTLTLGTSNDYSFPTIVGQGTLKLAGGFVIPDGAGKSGLILNGTLDLNGNTEAVNGFDGSASAVVNNSAGSPATLIVGSNNASGTYLGTIQNTGGALTLVKVGTQTNRFFAANSHTGGNIFRQGTTELTNGSALGSSSAPLAFGGTVRTFGNINNTAPTFELVAALTLNLSNDAAVTISGNIVGSNLNPTFNGSGSVTLTGGGQSGGFRPQSVALTTTGIYTNSTDVLIGTTAGNVASWVVNGGRIVMDEPGSDFRVGNNTTATGTLHVTNNAEILYQDFFIALDDNSTGRVYQTSGIITNQEIGGAEVRFAGNNAAADAGTRAEYYLSGNARFYSGALLSIGENGIALVSLSDTAQMVAQDGVTHIGRRTTNAVGTLTVNAGTSFTQLTNAVNVGTTGTGTMNIGGTVTIAPGNNLAIGVNAGANGTVNLNPGGVLNASRIIDGAGNSTFNFYGGTLEVTGSSTDYMRNISNVVINSSGAFINTGANNIGILVGLKEDGGDPGGGLVKTGTGSLTLGGSNNTYTGTTDVQAGTLILTTPYGGLSPITVADGAGFGVTIPTATNTVTSLNSLDLGTATGATVTFDIGVGNPSNAVFTAGTVTPNGTVTINVVGGNLTPGTFTLIDYNSLAGGGFGAFAEGTYPRGVDADLFDNFGNSSVDLIVNSVDPVIWSGATDNIWDTNTANWTLLAAPTAYIDGDSVLFPEGAANTSIQIVSNWSPLGVVVSNDATTYTFNAPSNTGIIGPTGLIKRGTGLLNLASSNRYSGPTTVSGGTLRFLTNDVMPNGAGFGNVTVDGVLDVNGFSDTMMALDGSGVVSNGSPNAATLTIGANGSSGSFSGTIEDNGFLTLRKTGAGTNVLLTASPTWNGGATIDAGTLQIEDSTALGTGPLFFEGGATLRTVGSLTVANDISEEGTGEGNFLVDNGQLVLTGDINWVGPADLNKTGSNQMTLSSTVTVNLGFDSEFAVLGGVLIVDGSTIVVTNDGFRVRATTNFPVVSATIQNNATLTLQSNANFSLGNGADTNLLTPDLTNLLTYVSGTTTFEGNGGLFVASSRGNSATFTQQGGTITFGSANNNGLTICNSTNTIGVYRLEGGTLTSPRVRENFFTNDLGTPVPELASSTFIFGGGTLRASSGVQGTNFMSGLDEVLVQATSARIDSDTFDVDIDQNLLADPNSPNGGLVKSGSGSLALNGANTFVGLITVDAGLLRGKGSVIGNITGAGKIGGGDSDEIGTFTSTGTGISLSGGAVMRVSHVGAVLSNDKVVANSAVFAHGGELTIIAIGTDFAVGDQFDLFDAATINGGFTSYNLGLLPPGLSWDASAVSTTGILRIVKTTQVMSLSYNGGANQVTLAGMGPEANSNYRVLTSTNMADPINIWVPVQTNMFDASSNFNSVITVNSNDTRRFFIIVNP